MNETVLTHARKHGPHRKEERKWLLENLDVQIYVLINFLNLTHRINNSIIASIVTSKKERERKMIERFNNQHLFAGKFSTNACMPTISKQISNKFQYVIQ